MANCPWNRKGCCYQNGMTMTSATIGNMNGICYGKQVNGMRYSQCKYYVNPKEGTSGNSRPCKYCQREYRGGRYYAYCCSNKYPGADGVTPQFVKDDNKGAICIGRRIGGKKYTECKYYKNAKKIQGQTSGSAYIESHKTSDISMGGIIAKVFLFYIMVPLIGLGLIQTGDMPTILLGLAVLGVWIYKIVKKFKKK